MKSVTDLIERERGSRNWVVARRSPRVLAQYGADVIALSRKEYARLEKQFELETMDQHPAYPWLKKLFRNHYDAVNILRWLREEGFRVERVESDRMAKV